MKKFLEYFSTPLARAGLEIFGVTVATIGVIAVLMELNLTRKERIKESIARNWTIVTTKAPGNSGKIAALEYLATQKNPTPLIGIDLSCKMMRGTVKTEKGKEKCNRPTYLRGLDLSPDVGKSALGANLMNANLSGTDLAEADLEQANLEDADLSSAILTDVDFERANFKEADLRNANIEGTIFKGANLSKTKFHQAKINNKTEFTKSWAWIDFLPEGKLKIYNVSVVPEYLCDPKKEKTKQDRFEDFLKKCIHNEVNFEDFLAKFTNEAMTHSP